MVRLSAIVSITFYWMFLPQFNLLAADLSKKPDSWFLSEEGRQTMEHLLSWQSDHGDWPKNTDTTTGAYTGDRQKLQGTFDNGATTGELRALARAFTLTVDARFEKAFLKGFDHILEAQYANGGWPQYFPLRKGYYTHITFNDNCMVRLLELLQTAITAKEFSFLDANRRDKAAKAIERGIDCIVKCQVVVNGTPTVWCAQHDAVTRLGAAIGQIEQVTHRAAAGAEEGSVAAEEMTAQAVALRGVVADLESMVGSGRTAEASHLD